MKWFWNGMIGSEVREIKSWNEWILPIGGVSSGWLCHQQGYPVLVHMFSTSSYSFKDILNILNYKYQMHLQENSNLKQVTTFFLNDLRQILLMVQSHLDFNVNLGAFEFDLQPIKCIHSHKVNIKSNFMYTYLLGLIFGLFRFF